MHLFPSDISSEIPEGFTNPFRYFPHPLVVKAAEEVIARIDSSEELRGSFAEGKMIGVLIVEAAALRQPRQPKGRQAAVAEMPLSWLPYPQGGSVGRKEDKAAIAEMPFSPTEPPSHATYGYLAAFSGSVGGKSVIEGFVPPIFDLLDPSGHFKIREAEITVINRQIESLAASSELAVLRQELSDAERDREFALSSMRARMAISKRERDEIRSELADPSRMPELIRQSQFEKAELKRLKVFWDERISGLRDRISGIEGEIKSLKAKRSAMSDELQ